jgi:hypothetical protein
VDVAQDMDELVRSSEVSGVETEEREWTVETRLDELIL